MENQTAMLKKVCAVHGIPIKHASELTEARSTMFKHKRAAIEQQFLLGVWGTCADCPKSIHGVHPELCSNATRYDHQIAADPGYHLLCMEKDLLRRIESWRPLLLNTDLAAVYNTRIPDVFTAYTSAWVESGGLHSQSIAGMYRCLQSVAEHQQQTRKPTEWVGYTQVINAWTYYHSSLGEIDTWMALFQQERNRFKPKGM